MGPESRYSVTACTALISREVKAVPRKYPMPPDSALRIAAALSHLVAWDQTYPQVRFERISTRSSLAYHFVQNIHPSVKVVRQPR